MRALRRLILVVAALSAGACNSSPAVLAPLAPPRVEHLYVSGALLCCSAGNATSIARYTLPLTPAAAPDVTVTVANGGIGPLAVDPAGNVAAALTYPLDDFGHYKAEIGIFDAPLTAASAPAATLTSGRPPETAYGLAFVPSGPNAGQLWSVAGDPTFPVVGYAPPFGNGTTPAAAIADPALGLRWGITFDPQANMYLTDQLINNGTPPYSESSTIRVYAPPYTGPPVVTPAAENVLYLGAVASATQLFVGAGSFGGDRIDVYSLPLSAASRPAFAITSGVVLPLAVALDAAGNLYVGNPGSNVPPPGIPSTVTVYAPPFSAASAPAVTLKIPTAPRGILNGMAVGT